ncbi:MAG: HlyD family efflux transporter periplasmic adaptor subunit [Butyrivibrio sp.]|uniref:HlyD family efflux transporter periplasmic adaptor subunit n=1 Tax=Butyrivibrio sp. TaxID=28121 RepID=UPI001B1AB554|nr:HlyD family efflux transporter periplasmic adaptor subunit [Butyrivibrio sp.]MBO6240142.1 HlyD family efflux transporter periplasmic adaptor subunit [Butyrivibrio sp.]
MNTLVKRIIAGGAGLAVLIGGVVYVAYPDGVDVWEVSKLDINASIDTVGTIEADDIVTIYAPVSGKVSAIPVRVNELVKSGSVLASYDLTSFEEDYQKASLNSEYYEDGYNAAVAENDKNKAKAAKASSSADALKSQYIFVEENRDDISIAQNKKSNYIQSTMKGIEGAISNMETNMQVESAKLETASSTYADLSGKLLEAQAEISGLSSQISSIESQIKSNAEAYDAIKDDESKTEEAEALKELNQKLSETLVELQSSQASANSKYSKLKDAVNEASDTKDSVQSSVNSIKDNITSSRDALSSLPVDNLTTEQYALYLELTRQLDIIEKEWNKQITEKQTSEEKIVNEYQIKQYEDSMEMARIDVDKALSNLSKSKEGVKTTVNGTIISKMIDAGATVSEGEALFTIQPDSGYKVAVMISKYDIGSVEIGQSADVVVSGETYTATVETIAPIATNDSAGKPRVKVELLFDEDVKPTIGLEAEVRINTGDAKDALSIPEKSVYTDDEGSFVYVLEKGKAKRANVETGLKGNGYYQVLSGLSEGVKVIESPLTEEDIGTRFVEN